MSCNRRNLDPASKHSKGKLPLRKMRQLKSNIRPSTMPIGDSRKIDTFKAAIESSKRERERERERERIQIRQAKFSLYINIKVLNQK